MQVFIIGSPLETAEALDSRRLNKQIIECSQILSALHGKSAWSNHPCVLQYRGYEEWLWMYKEVLYEYYLYAHNNNATESLKENCFDLFVYWNNKTVGCTPPFHTQEYFAQMKRRLYTKDNNHYKQWAHLGESQENWYFVDNEWRKYINGKRIE